MNVLHHFLVSETSKGRFMHLFPGNSVQGTLKATLIEQKCVSVKGVFYPRKHCS